MKIIDELHAHQGVYLALDHAVKRDETVISTATGSTQGDLMERHIHEETETDVHTNDDGAQVETQTTEKTEAETPESDE